ncbi:hypothetical protein F9L33_03965 [Amylibacter sp. SFDW26]|uniref:hypothetical protein n=1 Tax=Amylibacter sp. SFDW26 TaxID=2652722 RepID=UPI001261CD60|nr:hypothetical protein [Amylibacter sp. SFDW26]KAB7615926.1 hypothetical protein F9L33_03965 [Amylibacter sp. SFDW26]
METKSHIRGPINYGDLELNMVLRKFLTHLSTPIRYASGLFVGLVLGALYAQYFTFFAIGLMVIIIVAILWVMTSLYFKSVVRTALTKHLQDGEKLSDFQQMYSRSWIAAVREADDK